jgi:3-oxoacyl-[acyl-carrier protein] reductase
MEIKLNNRKALVGGSTQGLGKAIAIELARCGADVTLMARNEEKLRSVVKELPCRRGQKHSYLVVDFSDTESFKTRVSEFLSDNPIDILVNNTNGPIAGSVLEKTPSDYQTAFELLFETVCHTTLESLPAMQRNGFGRIINVASVSVKEPLQHLALSNTIRASVVSWAKTLATDMAKDNITVNNILTGYFDTERIQDLIKFQAAAKNMGQDQLRKQMEANVPMKRFGKPEEYGYLVAFLASDMASYITGSSIAIDGGLLKSV